MSMDKKQPDEIEETTPAAEETAVSEEAAATEAVAAENAGAEAAADTENAADTAASADAEAAPDTKKKPFAFLHREKKVRSADAIRRLRHGRTARILTVCVVILVFMFNYVFSLLADRYPLTIDLSSDKLFSLSDSSVELAKSVSAPIQIVVLTSEEVFSNTQSTVSQNFSQGFQQVSDALSEFYNAVKMYNSYSGGKITTTFVDMNTNPTAVAAYQKLTDDTLQSGSILFICGDRCKTANVGSDLFTVDTSSYQTTGSYTFTSIVEQTLAAKIKLVQNTENKVLTVFTGHGESSDMISSLQSIYDINGYDVQTVDLTKSVDISKDTVCAIIPAPTTDYSATEIERLRQWLSNDNKEGRNLLVFAHPTATCARLYEFLQVEYGMEVTNNIVVESDLNRMASYNGYCPYGDIKATDYTKNSVGDAAALTYYTRQIIPHWAAKDDTNTNYSVNLVTYSDQAKLATVDSLEKQDTSPTTSAYNGTIVGMAVAVKEGFQSSLQQSTVTKVAVCGSANSVYSYFLSMDTIQNENLFLDTMSTLTGVTNTVNISSKSLEAQTVSFSNTTQIFVGLILFTLLLPVGLLVYGLVVFLKRRHL